MKYYLVLTWFLNIDDKLKEIPIHESFLYEGKAACEKSLESEFVQKIIDERNAIMGSKAIARCCKTTNCK